ncbi:basic leucine zipper transcriptional factor ATF-like 3 [Astyanax mexicanus]|uniref:Basic leucine zipper transcriptional factor ATF-like 3 n=2 Tax=Astyanax mexicanus TaxID=7994 RepID=A0A8B9JTS6_ASTMX|nr:basic leucine zipper transcriptional factor ATF-like 3 [Astyanax mexicanus]KAG9282577.1 basic leucine zipper transcriptional factor ATF-like 3 [Astyanax mexicanus]
MSSAPDYCPPSHAPSARSCLRSESSDDDERRLKRREKNRVAAQRSRKRQTQRADELHEAYECLEQQNSLLKKEVQLLLEEQKCLSEALQSHEPLCPILNSSALPAARTNDAIPP